MKNKNRLTIGKTFQFQLPIAPVDEIIKKMLFDFQIEIKKRETLFCIQLRFGLERITFKVLHSIGIWVRVIA
jgi:hypothetical protein